jgi:hypothetical protein
VDGEGLGEGRLPVGFVEGEGVGEAAGSPFGVPPELGPLVGVPEGPGLPS